jgi:hypothetical protein
VVPYIKIALEIEDGKELIYTNHDENTIKQGYHSVLDYTGIWVHAVSERLVPDEKYYHKDLVLHYDSDTTKYNIPGGVKLTSGYLTVTPVDDNDVEQLALFTLPSDWVYGEPNTELARTIINELLSTNECVFIDEETGERQSVHVRYCRAHEESYKKE